MRFLRHPTVKQRFVLWGLLFGHIAWWQAVPVALAAPSEVASSLEHIRLIRQDGSIHPALLSLMRHYKLRHDGTPASINKALQNNFLRRPGQERWELNDTLGNHINRASVLQWLQQMALTTAIPPVAREVDYFLLFGALYSSAYKRLEDWRRQYNKGLIRCKQLVLLAGNRQLLPREIAAMRQQVGDSAFQRWRQRMGRAKTQLTEALLWEFLWEHCVSTSVQKKFIRGKNWLLINETGYHPLKHRPTTSSTLFAWHALYHPSPGRCHANVEKPFAVRMEKTLRTFLLEAHTPGGWTITWNSAAAAPELPLAVYCDCLARTFYQELQLQAVKKSRTRLLTIKVAPKQRLLFLGRSFFLPNLCYGAPIFCLNFLYGAPISLPADQPSFLIFP